MSLQLVLAIIALVLAVIAGIMSRASTPMIMIAVAIALVALVQILSGGLVFRWVGGATYTILGVGLRQAGASALSQKMHFVGCICSEAYMYRAKLLIILFRTMVIWDCFGMKVTGKPCVGGATVGRHYWDKAVWWGAMFTACPAILIIHGTGREVVAFSEDVEYRVFEGEITYCTDAAILVTTPDADKVWIPRSVCCFGESLDIGDEDPEVAEWWLEKEGQWSPQFKAALI
jgi:hypothetical protein